MPVKLNINFLLLFIVSFSCVERFNPSIDEYEDLLVVDGYFTNEEKSHQIILYYTSDVYSTEFEPVLEADVKVVSDDGDVIQFYEINSSGEYFSAENAKAEAGKQYKLIVLLDNSEYYETEFQELITCPSVDAVYGERETQQTSEIGEELDGLQFYLDTKKEDEKSVFYQWKLTETYEYNAEYLLDSYYAGGTFEFIDKDSLYTCYKTNTISDVYTHSIKYSDQESISRFPLLYVGNDTKKLSVKYSLNVKQYTLNEGAYNYWHSIEKQIENEGVLYSTQPYQVMGNLKNINNPDEVVLGYFVVAGMSEKRIFVDKPSGLVITKDDCTINTSMMELLPQAPQGMWPFFLVKTTGGQFGVVDEACVNCLLAGGELTKPDFWN